MGKDSPPPRLSPAYRPWGNHGRHPRLNQTRHLPRLSQAHCPRGKKAHRCSPLTSITGIIECSPCSLCPALDGKIPDLTNSKQHLFPPFLIYIFSPVFSRGMEAAARFAALTRLNLPFFEYTREFYRVRRSDGIGGCHTQFAVLARGQLSLPIIFFGHIHNYTEYNQQ